MKNLKEELENLKERIKKFKDWFDFEEKRKKAEEIEEKMNQLGFWDNPEQASKISEELSNLKKDLKFWEGIEKEVDDLSDLLEEEDLIEEIKRKIEELDKQLKKEELKVFLSGEYDKNGAIVNISAGQGGHDAEDFVRILFNMYSGYLEDKDWSYSVLSQNYSEEAGSSEEARGGRGLKNITFEISHPFAYGYLKNESGTHRLVRVSPFDAKKLRHTSFALVEVLPKIENQQLNEIELDEKDLRFDFFRSSGPGGQSVNKRETAVRVVHLPTGLSSACQSQRSQIQNREKALEILKTKLFNYLKNQAKGEISALKKRIIPSWGNQIRNYILHPYKLVKDLKTNIEVNKIEDVLEGKIDEFIQAGVRMKD
jgi:peptide chain release factor 2